MYHATKPQKGTLSIVELLTPPQIQFVEPKITIRLVDLELIGLAVLVDGECDKSAANTVFSSLTIAIAIPAPWAFHVSITVFA